MNIWKVEFQRDGQRWMDRERRQRGREGGRKEKEREIQRNGERIFLLLTYFTDACNGQGYARIKPIPETPFESPTWVQVPKK